MGAVQKLLEVIKAGRDVASGALKGACHSVLLRILFANRMSGQRQRCAVGFLGAIDTA